MELKVMGYCALQLNTNTIMWEQERVSQYKSIMRKARVLRADQCAGLQCSATQMRRSRIL